MRYYSSDISSTVGKLQKFHFSLLGSVALIWSRVGERQVLGGFWITCDFALTCDLCHHSLDQFRNFQNLGSNYLKNSQKKRACHFYLKRDFNKK